MHISIKYANVALVTTITVFNYVKGSQTQCAVRMNWLKYSCIRRRINIILLVKKIRYHKHWKWYLFRIRCLLYSQNKSEALDWTDFIRFSWVIQIPPRAALARMTSGYITYKHRFQRTIHGRLMLLIQYWNGKNLFIIVGYSASLWTHYFYLQLNTRKLKWYMK